MLLRTMGWVRQVSFCSSGFVVLLAQIMGNSTSALQMNITASAGLEGSLFHEEEAILSSVV